MIKKFFFVFLVGCPHPDAGGGTELSVHNSTSAPSTVYVSFGSDSTVTAKDWSFCEGEGLSCSFPLGPKAHRNLPLGGRYGNLTVAFDGPVGCGVTKSEFNLNNPSWYDQADVSLVDGYSNNIKIDLGKPGGVVTSLGPVQGKDGNEGLFGVFPYGCDVCVSREDPPCGISKGSDGCKAGDQYDPDPPCQWQGEKKGGGDMAITLVLE